MTLTIKNVPPELARQLRARAKAHHRSLQGELMAIITAAAQGETAEMDLRALAERSARRLAPQPSESVAMIRADRDAR